MARGTLAAASGWLHALALAVLVIALPSVKIRPNADQPAPPEVMRVVLPRLVFQAVHPVRSSGGGGGGGNRQPGPIRRAEAKGHDAYTLRIAKPVIVAEHVDTPEPALPGLALNARPLASGIADQIGLPVGGVSTGLSTGSGSGGGVGTGTGTGVGPGRGPGLGAGFGGGVGGGRGGGGAALRPGGAVTAPRLLAEVKPRYTSDALGRKIEGSVWLDLVVTRDSRIEDVRVIRSLDPGLDEEAVAAVRQWHFLPGRIGNTPVDVAITVAMDFSIR
jgi:TonB family protein